MSIIQERKRKCGQSELWLVQDNGPVCGSTVRNAEPARGGGVDVCSIIITTTTTTTTTFIIIIQKYFRSFFKGVSKIMKSDY